MNNWTMLEDQWPEHRQVVLAYCHDPSGRDLDPVGFYYVVVAPLKYNEEGRKIHGSDMFFVDFNGIGPNHMGHDVIAWRLLPDPPE